MIDFRLKIPVVDDSWWDEIKYEVTEIVEEANKQSWAKEKDPVTGKKWEPRQKSESWPLLRKTGRMQRTARFKPGRSPMSIEVQTTDYGPIHQNGTKNIPQRRWLGMPRDMTSALRIERLIFDNIFKKSRWIT